VDPLPVGRGPGPGLGPWSGQGPGAALGLARGLWSGHEARPAQSLIAKHGSEFPLGCSILLPLELGPSGALKGLREVHRTYQHTTHGGSSTRNAEARRALERPCVVF
jgi:hypothetical protein